MAQPTIADRLQAARLSRFVGRGEELDLFDHALRSPVPEFSVLFIHGPGGVGKTALLEVYADLATRHGRQVIRLDARSMEPTPPGVKAALGTPEGGAVVLVDTYEAVEALDSWLRGSLLPSLPQDVLVVLAGRNRPLPGWVAEPGWGTLVRVLPLRNLSPAESRRFLAARGVGVERSEAAMAFTHGHPLALTLVAELADDHGRAPFRAEQEPDIVRALVQRFVEGVPTARHRDALEACAHLRTTTEERLAEALGGGDDVAALFDWLRGLSFVEQTAQGIIPHDLAREVLDSDLRWRNFERYARLHRAIRDGVVERIRRTTGVMRQQALFDLLYLHRNNPVMAQFHQWESMGTAYAEPATDDDLPEILAMVEHHEGDRSAGLAGRWYRSQPGAFTAFRTLEGELIGFHAIVELHVADADDIAADPATRAAVDFARRSGPLRQGEAMIYSRFQMGREVHYGVSTVMDLIALTTTQSFLTTPRLAWNFIAVTQPELLDPVFTHLNLRRSPEADFTVDAVHYTVYTHDWRAEPPAAWLELMSDRELDVHRTAAETPAVPGRSPVVVLSEAEFAIHVRQALRNYTRPEALMDSPLLCSRVVVELDGPGPAAEKLLALLREATGSLRANPRDEKLYRAVDRTYLRPAPTQELAAKQLDLPFSTYRSHLTAGLERITGWLWRRELSGHPDSAEI